MRDLQFVLHTYQWRSNLTQSVIPTAPKNEFENYFDKSEESVTVERRYKTILVWLRNFVNLNRGFVSI